MRCTWNDEEEDEEEEVEAICLFTNSAVASERENGKVLT